MVDSKEQVSHLDVVRRVQELEDRLQISPYGDDKIDELESCIEHLRHQIQCLEEWKAGVIGAVNIMYPAGIVPHTFDAFCAHKAAYEQGTENYRKGADLVAGGFLAAKERF